MPVATAWRLNMFPTPRTTVIAADKLLVVKAAVHIGISGWRYAPWRGVFYPKGLVQRRELEFAARRFDTIEINGSFYSLQDARSWQAWHDATPKRFLFAVKCPRFISHIKRLREIEAPLANFFASGVLLLGTKLGPLLWQFPPNMKFDEPLWQDFFALLPRSQRAAARLAQQHDARVAGAAVPKRIRTAPVKYAIEVRNESFCCEAFIELLRQHHAALVVADSAGHYPHLEDVTTDFMYLRLHGAEELYASGYDDKALRAWARRIRAWSAGGEPRDAKRISHHAAKKRARSVYCYFDNDAKVHAPFDAERLRLLLDRGQAR
jgi:uncharacterized protein YecE (DUF72 family)